MSISADEILNFATECSNKDGEINYRNAIARSYYAAYHRVKGSLVNEPDNNNSSVHSHLIKYLENDADRNEPSLIGSNNGRIISYMLKTLKTRRVIAEYELEDNFDQQQAFLAVADARKIFSKCDDLFK